MGASAASVGARQSLRTSLQSFGGEPATLHWLLGVSPWLVIGVLGVTLGAWPFRNRPEEGEHGKWSWPVTGVVMGLVIVLRWYLSSLGGSHPASPSRPT